MKYYQELTILPNEDLSPFFIWEKMFPQIHLALVEVARATYGKDAKFGDIGVSFPEYRCEQQEGRTFTRLGAKLRVFANTQAELEQLNLDKRCEDKRLLDYVDIKPISAVGDKAKSNVLVKRFRQEKNYDTKTKNFAKKKGRSFDEVKAKRIERISKQKGITLEEAKEHYENPRLEQKPYIKLKSESNQRSFSLEIEQQPVDTVQQGKFSTYGFSTQATVPHW